MRIDNINRDSAMEKSLKEIRKQLGFTQEQTAKILKISRRSYQYYEKDERVSSEQKRKIRNSLLQALIAFQKIDETHGLLTVRHIQEVSKEIFKQHPKITCAFLYGSYARGEATEKSDVDILVIIDGHMGLEFFEIAEDLRKQLNKKVDLVSLDEIVNREEFIAFLLNDGIKIYKQNAKEK